jgi:hypothetical protein
MRKHRLVLWESGLSNDGPGMADGDTHQGYSHLVWTLQGYNHQAGRLKVGAWFLCVNLCSSIYTFVRDCHRFHNLSLGNHAHTTYVHIQALPYSQDTPTYTTQHIMKPNLPPAVPLLALIATTNAHSWVHCTAHDNTQILEDMKLRTPFPAYTHIL